MHSRIITCSIKLNDVEKFRRTINNEFLPRIQASPGFLENIESVDPSTGQYCCVTVWKSEADVKNYDQGLFQEIAGKLGPLMAGAPAVLTLPVDNASAHNMRAGRARAEGYIGNANPSPSGDTPAI
jgi:heme-degrading monooxygenase HmoA